MLKEAGLVEVQPRGQQRVHELRGRSLRQLHNWLERYRQLWEARFEGLDALVEELKEGEKERPDARNKSSIRRTRRSMARSRRAWSTGYGRPWSSSSDWFESFIATRDSQYTSHDLELQASDAIEKRVALREGNQ